MRKKEYAEAMEAAQWLNGYLESLKLKPDEVTYVDKIRARLYATCAIVSEKLAGTEETKRYLRKAYEVAKAFDDSPVYSFKGIKFCIGEVQNAAAYDTLGATAMEAIELEFDRNGEDETNTTRAMWEEIIEEKKKQAREQEGASDAERRDG